MRKRRKKRLKMASRKTGGVQGALERVVAKPMHATLTVGTSILLLLALIKWLNGLIPGAGHLKYLIPFIPPFFITRTAKRINQRRAEHDFIKDAAPYIFIAFPKEASAAALRETCPCMVSDASSRHLNLPLEKILESPALPTEILADPTAREQVIDHLLKSYRMNEGRGVLENHHIELLPQGAETPKKFLMNSVLTTNEGGQLKWQASLMGYHPWGVPCPANLPP